MNIFSKAGILLLMVASPVGLLHAATPQPGIHFSGNVELDTDAVSTELTDTMYDSGGRVKLQIDGRRDFDQYFVSGKGELLAKVDGATEAEDAWLMLGHIGYWNVRVGRYENTHMFPEGRDTLILHATDTADGNAPVPYEMDAVRGRADNGVRLRVQAVENWLFELGTFYGGGDNEELFGGIRPVVEYDAGGLINFRIGYEKLDNGVSDLSGYGGSIGIRAGDATIYVNLTELDDELAGLDSTTLGVNVELYSFVLGIYEAQTDYDNGADPSVTTIYGSYSHMIDSLEDTYITYAFSTSSSSDVADGSDDQVDAVRVRLNYEF